MRHSAGGCRPAIAGLIDETRLRTARRQARRLVVLVASLLVPIVPAAAQPAAAGAPPAADLLRAADRARGGVASGITWTATVDSTEDGQTTSRTFLVKARDTDALVEALAPPRHKGEVMLFNDRTIWFVKPGLRKPVSVSARQRLSGEAANGDIATTNYARDYEGTVVGEELVGEEAAWRLELKAKAKNVTYDRIRYWISKGRRLGLKAEFLTLGGDLFKTATFEYENTLRSGGARFEFVSRMAIRSATGSGGQTTIRFDAPRHETHPPSMFNINNVVR
jgi:outer membrane lipoprotein-sorting protein